MTSQRRFVLETAQVQAGVVRLIVPREVLPSRDAASASAFASPGKWYIHEIECSEAVELGRELIVAGARERCPRCHDAPPNGNGCALCTPEVLGERLAIANAKLRDADTLNGELKRAQLMADKAKTSTLNDALDRIAASFEKLVAADRTVSDAFAADKDREFDDRTQVLLGELEGQVQDLRRQIGILEAQRSRLTTSVGKLVGEVQQGQRDLEAPLPMLLWCPSCNVRHIDEGPFIEKVHHTHACQSCGVVWRPAIRATVGVRFLPGFLNAAHCNAHVAFFAGCFACDEAQQKQNERTF